MIGLDYKNVQEIRCVINGQHNHMTAPEDENLDNVLAYLRREIKKGKDITITALVIKGPLSVYTQSFENSSLRQDG